VYPKGTVLVGAGERIRAEVVVLHPNSQKQEKAEIEGDRNAIQTVRQKSHAFKIR